jgi:Mg-chelatase subunit ChlD
MHTQITFVLDSSGSMSKIEDDTKGGFNTFVRDQQEEEGTATVSLYDFNTTVTPLYEAIPIDEVEQLTHENYSPGGRTALHDAISTAIKSTDDHIETLPSGDEPDNVIVVVLTDGKENASETSQDTVREMVEEYRDEYDWEFVFIGANQDAALTAESMGMDSDKSLDMSHSGEGTKAAYESTSELVTETRKTGQSDGFNEEDRQRQREADDS